MIEEDEKAIADFTEVIKKNPKNAHAYFRRAFSYKRIGVFFAFYDFCKEI